MTTEKNTSRIDGWLEAHAGQPKKARKPRTARRRLRPLLVDARVGADLLGMSTASFYRRLSAGEIGPEPLELGGRKLWRYRDLAAWVDAGCPPRDEWLQKLQRLQNSREKPEIP